MSRLRIEEDEDDMLVRIRVEAPTGVITSADHRAITKALTEHFEKPVEVDIHLLEYTPFEPEPEPEPE